MENKKIVVTGGAGFIGSNLSRELSKNNEVIIIDDFSTGSKENIQELIFKGNTTLIEGSVTDIKLLENSFKDVDYVFHNAEVSSIVRSIRDPIPTNTVNSRGTLNVLIASVASGVDKMIYSSTSAVYGNSDPLPKLEKMFPQPISPYAVSKLAGEYYCRVFYELYRFPTTILRYFNIYGPGQSSNFDYTPVIPEFITKILKNKPPVIHGSGEQTRDFIFIEDAIKATILAAESKKTDGEILNIASNNRISIKEVGELIMNLLDKELDFMHDDSRPGDIKHSQGSIEKAKELLCWEPKINLEEGMKRTIDYFSSRADNNINQAFLNCES